MAVLKAGNTYNIPPEPHKPELTRMIEAGALRFGVETRSITADSMRASYASDPVALARFNERYKAGNTTLKDGGLTIHVFAADGGHEYLRFDCFQEDPHYHYNNPVGPGEEVANHRVHFDPVACGDMFQWTLAALRERLPQMLEQARGAALASRVDQAAVARAVDSIAELAHAKMKG